jgi:HPt (histidine-containing phosphotransfer) domain-containing protein
MSQALPPTPALAELAAMIGPSEAQALARVFLQDTAGLIDTLATPHSTAITPSPHLIAAHNLKSTAHLIGAYELSTRARDLELRLKSAGASPTRAEVDALRADYQRIQQLLASFVRG